MERDVAWKKYDEAELGRLNALAADYIDFISENKTERECCAAAVAMAEEAGYVNLETVIAEGRSTRRCATAARSCPATRCGRATTARR